MSFDELTYMQKMEIYDTGKCKCPTCRKFRKESDFKKQDGAININGIGFMAHVHIAPKCNYCLSKIEQSILREALRKSVNVLNRTKE